MSLFHSKKKGEPNKINEDVVMVPDHKHKHCMQCGKEFSMFHRKHHCRKCGNLVCDDCSKQKWYIESPSAKGNQRVCDTCFHELSNHHPVVSNPQYQVLTPPTFISWIQTFEKSWIRSRYPKKYKKYKRSLLHGHYDCDIDEEKEINNLKNPKPSNATIASKFTPKVLERRKSKNDDNNDSLPANKSRDSVKSKYQRPQKEKYANMSTSKKQSKNDSNGPPQMSSLRKSITRKRKYNPLVVVQTGVLYVNIMEAQGLPDCDTFSQPDGYCIFYVTNNDPCFGQTTKYSTRVQHNTVKIY